jgi:RNA polymerase sigma factor (sigma-70 family)
MPAPHDPLKRQTALEDDRLLQQAGTGDQRAFERLVERHGPWLLHLIGRIMRDEHLAHDILQQVWLQLYRSLPTLRLEGTLSAWLARVARNRCLDELRRTRLLTFSELASGEEDEEVLSLVLLRDPAPLPEELIEWHELQESLQAAIDALPPRVRAVVLLRAFAQLSYGEIGQALRMPVSTAKTTFFRAKRLLRATRQLEDAQEASAAR